MASDPTSDQESVRQAAALGWALSEFLSRCYSLSGAPPPSEPNWPEQARQRWPVPPPATQIRTPRQTVRALIYHIAYLAQQLDVSSKIPNDLKMRDGRADPNAGKAYADLLTDDTKALTQLKPDDAEKWKTCLGDINQLVFIWDMKIQDGLQCKVAAAYNSYLIARNLAALQWTLTFNAKATLPANTWLQDDIEEFRDAIYLLAPYLPDYAPGALAHSVTSWKQALYGDVNVITPDDLMWKALGAQAEIWHTLVTGSRDPLSYVDITETTHVSALYFWRVLKASWPLFVVALAIVIVALVVVLVIVNVYTHAGASVYIGSAIAGAFAFLTLAGTSLVTVNAAWQKGAGNLLGTVGHALTDQLWASAQQEAVNRATLVPPPSQSSMTRRERDAASSQGATKLPAPPVTVPAIATRNHMQHDAHPSEDDTE